MSFRLFDCYACLAFFYMLLEGVSSVLFFIAIFFTPVLRVYSLQHKVVRWLPIPWFRLVWFSVQFITVPIYSWDCRRYRRLLGGCYGTLVLSHSLSLSRFLALLFDTLFNHRLYTVTAAADGRSAFVLFSGPRRFFVIFCLHPFLAALHKEYSCTLLLWPRSFLMDSFPFFLCFLWLLFIVRTRLHYRTFFFFPFFTGLPAAHPPCALTVDVRIEKKKIDTAIDWCGWLLDEIPRETCVSKR